MIENLDIIKESLDGDKQEYNVLSERIVNLGDVEKYSIDLDALDSFLPIDKTEDNIQKKEEDVWQNLDVRLIEIINSFISTSERPVFLVRDDKIVYINSAALSFFDIGLDKDFIGSNFFNIVVKEDWSILSENIGEMLTASKEIQIRIKNVKGKITSTKLRAIYLPESDHFSFILFGEHQKVKEKKIYNNLYDEKTGLPNFFLFEDRVQVAIKEYFLREKNEENFLIAIMVLNIDNIKSFKKMNIDEFIIDKVITSLALSLPKNLTIAMGIKYTFWLMLKAKNNKDLDEQIVKISKVLSVGIKDNFVVHDLIFSMGVASFPHDSCNFKELMEKVIEDLENNQKRLKK